MKSERRHELATNELADWITHFPQWFEENKTTVIVGAVIAVGLIAYTIFFYSRESKVGEQKQEMAAAMLEQLGWERQTVLQGKVQGMGVSDIFLNTAGSLSSVAEETDNQFLSALALIKKAEALRTELHYRPVPAEADVQKYQLEQAKTIYQQALTKAKGNRSLSAMAEYGTALCLEDMGDFDGAKKLYEKIADSAEYQGSSFETRAKFRAETMDDYKQKVYFAKVEPAKQMPQQQSGQQLYGPLKSQAPATETNMASQEDLDFNLSK